MKRKIKKILVLIDRGCARGIIGLIRCYQWTISPDKGIFSFFLRGKVCPHEPHCSEYGVQILQRYGFWFGLPLVIERVLSCLPNMQKIYDPSHYRIVFVSSAQIGVPFLKELVADQRFEVIGVVTQPDKPVGRGLKMQANIIKTQALELGISPEKILTPNKINPEKSLEGKNFYDWLNAKKPDFIVVIAYGKLIPQSILELPPFGAINVHGSLLPKYRGASPIQTIFLDQQSESGITIMHMDAGMDTGAIVDQKRFSLPFEWTCMDCIDYMQKIGPKFLAQTLWNYAKDQLRPIAQDETQVIHCQKIEKSDGKISVFSDSLEQVYAKYRAYFLRPKIFFLHRGKSILIEKLVLDEQKFHHGKQKPLLEENGVLHEAVVEILLKPEGKKAMNWESFKNGYLQ